MTWATRHDLQVNDKGWDNATTNVNTSHENLILNVLYGLANVKRVVVT